MKILILTDSYKDFASSRQIGLWIKDGILSFTKKHNIKVVPIGDGGEGTIEAIITEKSGYTKTFKVHDPLFREIKAEIGFYDRPEKTAVIEIAKASGSAILKTEDRDTMVATSFGTGEMILSALNENCKQIIIGLGGSIVSDGGMGMAQALGVTFYDHSGRLLKPIDNRGFNVKSLLSIDKIDISNIDHRIKETKFIIAADVNTPLLGPGGQAETFGPQKNATREQIKFIEQGLTNWNRVLNITFKKDFNVNKAGAAGGLGAGLSAFLSGDLRLGINVIAENCMLTRKIKECDWVVTGEGKLDATSNHGKTVIKIAELAKEQRKKVAGVFGIVENEELFLKALFDLQIETNKKKISVFEDRFITMIGKEQIIKSGYHLAQMIALKGEF